jgi:hypothetical protein
MLLASCANFQMAEVVPSAQRVGADRDARGCIGSAGYAWCARESACVRPWELADVKGFENNEQAFTAYCATHAR